MTLLVADRSIFHLFELPDQTIGYIDFTKIGHIWGSLIVIFGDVVGFDGSSVDTERSAGVIDFLLEDTRRSIDIDGRVSNSILISELGG